MPLSLERGNAIVWLSVCGAIVVVLDLVCLPFTANMIASITTGRLVLRRHMEQEGHATETRTILAPTSLRKVLFQDAGSHYFLVKTGSRLVFSMRRVKMGTQALCY